MTMPSVPLTPVGPPLPELECELVDAYDSGDHTIFIGRVLAAEDTDRQPLVFFRGKFGSLSVDLPRE